MLVLAAFGFSASAESRPTEKSIGALVETLVTRVESRDEAYFNRIISPSNRAQMRSIISMIQRSGMRTNYMDRLEMGSSSARLNYHWLERHCHFQIGLTNDKQWRVTSISLCR